MKKLATAIIAAALFVAAPSQAGTMTQNFDVKVDLTAACRVQNGPITTPVLDFGVYTAFVGAATSAPTNTFAIECTRNLATPALDIDGTAVDGTTKLYGVLAGLNYSVTASSSVTTPGTAATATAGGVGSADVRTVTLTGDMPTLQAGACSSTTATACAGVQTNTHTLTVTY